MPTASVSPAWESEARRSWRPFAGLLGYQRFWLSGDLLAGLTLVAVAVPEQLATAHLAGMPPVAGLVAFVVAAVVVATLGAHRTLSVGADSTTAPVLAAGVLGVAAARSTAYGADMAVLTVMVGVLLLAIAVARLGWLARFLSIPATAGILLGIAVTIAVHQLPAILGVASGTGSVIGRLRALGPQLGHVQPWAVILAGLVLAVTVASAFVSHRVPGALIGVGLATALVAAFHLDQHGLPVIGTVSAAVSVPHLSAVRLSAVGHLLPTAVIVAFLVLAQTAATERAAPPPPGAGVADLDRDLGAIGVASLASGLLGSFAVNASPPRTAIVCSSGGRSQVGSLVAALLTVLVLLFAGPVLALVPLAALGAVLLFVAAHLLEVGELRRIRAFDVHELLLALVTAVAVVIAGVEAGAVSAVVLSLVDRIRREAKPTDTTLGRESGTTHWIPTDIGRPTETVPGVLVYLVYAPLWYADADHVAKRIRRLVGEAAQAGSPLHAVILDFNAVGDIDYTGARMIADLTQDLADAGITVAIARVSHLVHHDLKHSGLLGAIGPDHVYLSTDEAVAGLSGSLPGGAPGGAPGGPPG